MGAQNVFRGADAMSATVRVRCSGDELVRTNTKH